VPVARTYTTIPTGAWWKNADERILRKRILTGRLCYKTALISTRQSPLATERAPSPPRCSLTGSLLWLVILGPPLFLFVAVQRSALTHPFWDYCELIPLFDRLQSGTLTASELFSPHNHTRPAVWRALLLANAWLTGWDIRSDYVYLLATLIGAFLVQAALLRVCGATSSASRRLALLAALSILSFSPVAHNNHWWSMMIQLDLAHLFIVIALAIVAWRPNDWPVAVLAALACWLATYTLTNGLVAFVSCAAVTQLFSDTPFRPTRLTIFWTANVLLCSVLYLPGLPESGGGVPSLWKELIFGLAYLGSPAAALVWFPFQSQFDIPLARAVTLRNAAAGVLVLLVLGATAYWMVRTRRASVAVRAFAAFALFALGSAALTSIGRAQFEAGLANANASRYTLFSSYALYALLYAATLAPSIESRSRRVLAWATCVVLVAVATVTYARSWKIYDEVRHFDRLLEAAYAAEHESPFDRLIYPEPDRVLVFKATLKRLRVGPYRDAPENNALEQLARNKRADEFGIDGLRAGPDGLILFSHPHSKFSLDVSREATAVTFRYGILPEALQSQPPTDGVEFRVLAADATSEHVVWSIVWRPAPGTPITQRVTVPLPREGFSGTLIFETLPAGRSESDWAYWADVSVTGNP
jgi:hypothetical protein